MSIAKIDVDVKLSQDLLNRYVTTRLAMVNKLGYRVIGYKVAETGKGYHVWIRVLQRLSEKELAELQFLLGDDQIRCRFNFLRLDMGAFSWFNCLFNRKKKRKWAELQK